MEINRIIRVLMKQNKVKKAHNEWDVPCIIYQIRYFISLEIDV